MLRMWFVIILAMLFISPISAEECTEPVIEGGTVSCRKAPEVIWRVEMPSDCPGKQEFTEQGNSVTCYAKPKWETRYTFADPRLGEHHSCLFWAIQEGSTECTFSKEVYFDQTAPLGDRIVTVREVGEIVLVGKGFLLRDISKTRELDEPLENFSVFGAFFLIVFPILLVVIILDGVENLPHSFNPRLPFLVVLLVVAGVLVAFTPNLGVVWILSLLFGLFGWLYLKSRKRMMA